MGLTINDIAPTADNARRVVTNPADPLAYPATARLLLTSMVGMDALPTSPNRKRALAGCMSSRQIADGAAETQGLITLGVAPKCVDFDERVCGTAVFNRNACLKRTFNLCPTIDQLMASPLQTSVGGVIDLAAATSDLDGDTIEYLWSASREGPSPNRTAATTSYTCTASGPQTITLTVWDGLCDEHVDVAVTCVASP